MTLVTIPTKKVVLVFQILILIIGKSYGQYIRAAFSNEKIWGNVATVADISYIMKDTTKVDSTIYTIKYDSKGYATDIYEHFPKTYKVDTTLFSHIPIRYEYDSKGNKIMTCLNDVVTYNKKGQEAKRSMYNKQNVLVEEVFHEYDENGNRIEDQIYTPRSNTQYWISYKYDIDKKLIEEIYEFPGAKYKLRYRYLSFDPMNNWTKRISTDEKGREFVTYRRITYAETPSK
jgi:hypothetical protein